jgi:predicted DNA-binding transcriptional regulator YafY
MCSPAVTTAFDKVRASLSRDALKAIDEMRDRLGVRGTGARLQATAGEHIPRIHRALAEHRTIRTRYYSASRDSEDDREIDPYQLTLFDGALYIAGYCHMRKEVRTFAVERVRTVHVTSARFTRPADFNAERYLADTWVIMRENLVTVRVIFSKRTAPYIRERLWHPSQKLRDLDDGRLEPLRAADTLEVRRWILGYGVQAEVVAPRGLREAMRLEAEWLAKKLVGRSHRSRCRPSRRDRVANKCRGQLSATLCSVELPY